MPALRFGLVKALQNAISAPHATFPCSNPAGALLLSCLTPLAVPLPSRALASSRATVQQEPWLSHVCGVAVLAVVELGLSSFKPQVGRGTGQGWAGRGR